MSDEKRLEVVRVLRTWIRTPWQHQGRVLGVGCDCIGVAVAAAYAAGPVPPEVEAEFPVNYGRFPHLNGMLRFMERHMLRITPDEIKAADIAMIAWHAYPMHLGVLTDYNQHGGVGEPFGLIHAKIEQRMVTEQRFDTTHMRVHSYWRFPALAD